MLVRKLRTEKWFQTRLFRILAIIMVAVLVATSLLMLMSPSVSAVDDYTFNQETVTDGYSTNPANKNAEDAAYNTLMEEDLYTDTNFSGSSESIVVGTGGGGTFPEALNTDDASYRSYTEADGSLVDTTRTLVPTSDTAIGFDATYPTSPTTHYDKIDEGASHDSASTYNRAVTAGDEDIYGITDMTDPTGTYDLDVVIHIICQDTSTGSAALDAGVYISSTRYVGVNDLVPPNAWADTTYTWEVNPNTAAEWTYAGINAMAIYVTVADATPDVDVTSFYIVVTIDYTPSYTLDVQLTYSSVTSTAQTISYSVLCQAYRSGAENFLVYAYDYVAVGWVLKTTVNAASATDFNFALATNERNGGTNEVKFRIIGSSEVADSTQDIVYFDLVKVKRLEKGYGLNVDISSTTVAQYGNITLRIKGYTSAERFNVNVWNYTSAAYDTAKIAITSLSNTWQTTLDLCDVHHRSTNTVKVQFTDNIASTGDTTQDTLYIDVAWITRYHTDPTITKFGATDLLINEGQTAYFWANYTDYDNEVPTTMQVHIDATDYNMAKNLTDVSYYNGVNYSYSTSALTNGNWTFYFKAQDANSGVVQSSSGTIAINAIPTLTGKGVDPLSGLPGTFSFYVTYTDEDDNAPAWVRVSIDGAWFNMVGNATNNGIFTDGESYYYQKSMAAGTHSYLFYTQDYNSGNISTASANVIVGTPPTITLYGVSPSSASEGTEVIFFACYTDADNDAPLFFNLDIEGLNWNMIANNSGDVTYTDGKYYYLANTNLTNANYTCYYKTQDVRSAQVNSGSFELVINALPVLSSGTVLPSGGNAGDWFNFTVTFTDDDGNYANYMQVVIDSTPYTMLEVNPGDDNTVDGKAYYYLKSMSGGTHPYYFKTADYLLVVVQTTPANLIVNNIPVLSAFGRTPADPLYVTTQLNFTCTFTDADNDLPVSVKWREDGGLTQNVTMTQVNPSDLTTTDGKAYFVWRTLGHGEHTYDFAAGDSGAWTSGGTNSVTIVNRDPVISNGPGASVNEWRNTAWQYDFDGSDADSDSITWGRSGYTWLSINPSTGMLSGTTPNTVGDYAFTVYANDSYGGQDTYVFTLHTINRAPAITNGPEPHVDLLRNQAWYYVFVANDEDSDTVSWDVSGDAWLTINAAGNLSGTTSNTPGTYSFTVYANDSYGGADTFAFDIHISNQVPVITNGPGASVNEWRNTVWSYDFDFTDPDSDSVAWARSGAGWLTIVGGTGVLSGTTTDTPGDYAFTVYANDSYGGSDSYFFTLHILNRAPLITSIGNTTQTVDTYMAYLVTPTDADGDVLTCELSTNATWLSVSGFWINGTATPIGWYTCTIWVNDSYGGSDSDSWEVDVVAPGNSAPSFTSSPIVTAGHPVIYTYDCNATDAEGDPLTFNISSTNPSLIIEPATGEVSGYIATPGEWYVNISVTDGVFTVWQNYTLTITNTPPAFDSSPIATLEHGTVYTYDAAAHDDDGDTYSFGLEGNCTSFLTIIPATGVITGTVPTVGSWTVHVSLTDGYITVWQNYTLTGTNTAPTFTSDVISEWQNGTSYYYDANGADINSDTLAWALYGNCTTFLSIDPLTGEVTGMIPSMGWWNVSIGLSDSWSTCYQNFTLYALNTAPVITTTPDTTCYTGDAYLFDADATDLNGDTITWDATEKPVWMVVDPSNGQCTGIPVIDGSYDVRLRAYDGLAYDYLNWTIVVTTYVPPIPEVPDEDEPDYSEPFYARFTYFVDGMNVVVEDDSIGDVVRLQWNFGDGFGSQDAMFVHEYAEPGTYIVTLTIFGPDGQMHSTSVEITVSETEGWFIEKTKVGWRIVTPLGSFGWGAAISLMLGIVIILLSFGGQRFSWIRPKTFKAIGIILLVAGVLFYAV